MLPRRQVTLSRISLFLLMVIPRWGRGAKKTRLPLSTQDKPTLGPKNTKRNGSYEVRTRGLQITQAELNHIVRYETDVITNYTKEPVVELISIHFNLYSRAAEYGRK